ncbi:MAG: tRNA pseudouridine(38-40) synthase TruA [Oscillospiraceae bacterium]|nr:tRNA pseudouridine(38-40) synthase TruA [Oscillospiraceae bacterium]
MNILLKLSFDGTAYHGWQIQENALSVFRMLQTALEKVLGYHADIHGCSRTDSGVHARVYCANFISEKEMTDKDLFKLPLALNRNLPEDIRVNEAVRVSDDFHARYSRKGKEYTYYILNSRIDDPFTDRYYHRISAKLDEQAMDTAASKLVGTHDFRTFMAAKSKIVDCTRTVYSRSVTRDGDMIRFRISADGYLYNMVRIMAGTLIKVGLGNIKAEDIEEIIAACDRSKAGYTAPAKGLFLTDIFYDPEVFI